MEPRSRKKAKQKSSGRMKSESDATMGTEGLIQVPYTSLKDKSVDSPDLKMPLLQRIQCILARKQKVAHDTYDDSKPATEDQGVSSGNLEHGMTRNVRQEKLNVTPSEDRREEPMDTDTSGKLQGLSNTELIVTNLNENKDICITEQRVNFTETRGLSPQKDRDNKEDCHRLISNEKNKAQISGPGSSQSSCWKSKTPDNELQKQPLVLGKQGPVHTCTLTSASSNEEGTMAGHTVKDLNTSSGVSGPSSCPVQEVGIKHENMQDLSTNKNSELPTPHVVSDLKGSTISEFDKVAHEPKRQVGRARKRARAYDKGQTDSNVSVSAGEVLSVLPNAVKEINILSPTSVASSEQVTENAGESKCTAESTYPPENCTKSTSVVSDLDLCVDQLPSEASKPVKSEITTDLFCSLEPKPDRIRSKPKKQGRKTCATHRADQGLTDASLSDAVLVENINALPSESARGSTCFVNGIDSKEVTKSCPHKSRELPPSEVVSELNTDNAGVLCQTDIYKDTQLEIPRDIFGSTELELDTINSKPKKRGRKARRRSRAYTDLEKDLEIPQVASDAKFAICAVPDGENEIKIQIPESLPALSATDPTLDSDLSQQTAEFSVTTELTMPTPLFEEPEVQMPLQKKQRSRRRRSADFDVISASMTISPVTSPSENDPDLPAPRSTRRSHRLKRQSLELYRSGKIKTEPVAVEHGNIVSNVTAGSDITDACQTDISSETKTEAVQSTLPMSHVNEDTVSFIVEAEQLETQEVNDEALSFDSHKLEFSAVQNGVTEKYESASPGHRAETSPSNSNNTPDTSPASQKKRGKGRTGKLAKKGVKRKREPAIEDIYLNKLWRSQMPKEKMWETIFEAPIVSKEGLEQFQSGKRSRRVVEFGEFYNQTRLKKRRQKALKLGWKPPTKKRQKAAEKLVIECLGKLESELEFEDQEVTVSKDKGEDDKGPGQCFTVIDNFVEITPKVGASMDTCTSTEYVEFTVVKSESGETVYSSNQEGPSLIEECTTGDTKVDVDVFYTPVKSTSDLIAYMAVDQDVASAAVTDGVKTAVMSLEDKSEQEVFKTPLKFSDIGLSQGLCADDQIEIKENVCNTSIVDSNKNVFSASVSQQFSVSDQVAAKKSSVIFKNAELSAPAMEVLNESGVEPLMGESSTKQPDDGLNSSGESLDSMTHDGPKCQRVEEVIDRSLDSPTP